jgi:hypothetical protein
MSRFFRHTLVELMNAFDFSSHDEITIFVNRFEILEADNKRSLPHRKLGIIEYLIDHPDTRGPFGANVVMEIIDYLLETQCRFRDPEEAFPRLVRALKRNGYVVERGKLKAMLPEDVQLAEKEDEFTTLLDQFGFLTTQEHFKQAISAHMRGEWAAANAQLRACIESLFDAIAAILVEDKTQLPTTSHGRRELLTRLDPPFLLRHLNEWEANGKGFVQGFWYRLHPEGAHPGLSSEEDSTLRLHLVIIIASHYLRRLHTRLHGC